VPDELKDLFGSEEDLQRILMLNKNKKRLKVFAKEKEREMRTTSAVKDSTATEDPF
jgi:hypothetical protein